MNNKEIAQKIVDRMLDTIKTEGKLPWTKPWGTKAGVEVFDGYTEITYTPRFWNRHGRPYEGINPMLLAMSGYEGEFVTFNQCKAEGGRVKKGEHATTVVFWTQFVKETGDLDPKTGDPIKKVIPVLKTYNVFHISQCEGLKQKHQPKEVTVKIPRTHFEPLDPAEPDDDRLVQSAEDIISGYLGREKTLTMHRDQYSDRAYYAPAFDSVTVPTMKQFEHVEEFYSTAFHELGHSTGHEKRLDRKIMNSFGSDPYSREELVAEITSASILNTLGLESGNSFRNSTAYIQSWSEHIKNDPMMFVTATNRASKAVNYILGIEEEDVA